VDHAQDIPYPSPTVPGPMDTLTEVRRRRLALGLSLGDLARAVGRSDATLSRIERGQIRPSYDLVQRILSFLEAQEGVATPKLTVADLMSRALTTVGSSAQLTEAARRMESGAFSQLPVVDDGRVVGSLSESGLLRALAGSAARTARVRDVLETAYPVVDEGFPADLLPSLLGRYPAVLVAHRGDLRGIVTKSDLIRGLRGTTLRRKPSA
jgi:predicted transcriptional regulator